MENTLPDITQTIVLNAPIQKVWDTVTTSEGIASWFMPNDFKLEVDHEFHIQSPFGPSPCKVTEVDAPNKLTFIWDTDGWVVSFILKELGDQTEFTLIHGGWKQPDAIIPKANQKSAIIRETMSQGWVGIVQNGLRKAVEN
ncbi:SRPBCC domain-containing protein [Psychrobacillus sp. NEAU-3TGS]|uniref:SRPBCC family protein n=1 Tax=Psychrobacillus sp. NEAU-3TGS TaxID=2995412 RepID=UPI002498DDBA|nr:SRPBCC domain-containing protein [Psychrobacillus sp. NEAU-3TGS]MDI2586340.1 SRPBCC domain-containing protein [Psychrobacillus sp. NEAU-3TGS]